MHKSVLLQETISYLAIKQDRVYVDATFGGGETALGILDQLSNQGRLIVIDLDREAIQRAQELKRKFPQIIPVQANFKDIKGILEDLGIEKVDGIIADLGISNFQLEDSQRGFSVEKDSPLDMRIDQDQRTAAYDILKSYSEKDLIELFQKIGEQPFSRRIAKAVKQAKNLQTTQDFYQIIQAAIPGKLKFKAKKIAINLFRALRMEVNQEIKNLEEFIPSAINTLNPNGKLVIISFHSIEDRIVKWKFRELAKKRQIEILTPKPIIPSQEEIKVNPKSRSAKLRICKRIEISYKK